MFNFILFSLSFETASSSCYAITQVLLRRVLRKAIFRKQKASYVLYRNTLQRFLLSCALRLEIKHLGVAQLVARYLGVTMTARSIVDHCAHPKVPTNDIGTNESAHLEIISQSGIPNGEIIAATQNYTKKILRFQDKTHQTCKIFYVNIFCQTALTNEPKSCMI